MGSREIQIQQLFDAMRTAEKTKDMDPRGYTKARIAYLRASQGDQWLTQETNRLRKEADETIATWRTKYDTLQGLRNSHRTNLDAVRAAQDTQVGLQDDVSYAISELKKLIGKDQDDALLKEREAYFRTTYTGVPPWVITALDALIVVLMVYVLYSVYTILGPRWNISTYLLASQRLKELRQRLQPSVPGRTPGMFL